MDVRVVGLAVVGVLVLVGGRAVDQFPGDGVLVGPGKVAPGVCQVCHAA